MPELFIISWFMVISWNISLGRPLDQRGDGRFISSASMRLFSPWKTLIKMQVAGKGAILNPYGIKYRLSINIFAGTTNNRPLDREARGGEEAVVGKKGNSVGGNSIIQRYYLEAGTF